MTTLDPARLEADIQRELLSPGTLKRRAIVAQHMALQADWHEWAHAQPTGFNQSDYPLDRHCNAFTTLRDHRALPLVDREQAWKVFRKSIPFSTPALSH